MERSALGYLTDLNRSVEDALTLLQKLAEYPELSEQDSIVYQSHFRESLATANLIVLDALSESEQKNMMMAYQRRIPWEKTIRDPDDCYLDIAARARPPTAY